MSIQTRTVTEVDRHRRALPSRLSVAIVSLLAVGMSLGLAAVRGDELSPPRKLSVAEGARPIWSPSRPVGRTADTSQPASASSTLRFVEAGWGGKSTPNESTNQNVVLRWRSRKPSPAFQGSGSTVHTTSGTWKDRGGVSGSSVRTVSHEQSVSPFDDPFGDKLAQNAELGKELPLYEPPKPKIDDVLQPATEPSAPPVEAPKLPSDPTEEPQEVPFGQMEPPTDSAPVDPSDPAAEPAESAEPPGGLPFELPPEPNKTESVEPEAPEPPLDLPPAFEPPKSPSTLDDTERPKEKSDKRVYYGRDCCKEEEKCKTARLALQQNSIKNISLDITASFEPAAESADEEREAREKQLRLMPPRKWRNRAGEVIADGDLTDLRNRRAVITDDDGNVAEIKLGELSDDDLCFLAAWWQVPTECTLGDHHFAVRQWEPVTFAWKASALCHKPMYFEEVQLERYGHTTGPFFQPVLSGAHFFLNVAVLPYKMGINPPNECQYALGYYRPGSCSPWLLPPAPLSVRGGLMEAGAITGLILLFP